MISTKKTKIQIFKKTFEYIFKLCWKFENCCVNLVLIFKLKNNIQKLLINISLIQNAIKNLADHELYTEFTKKIIKLLHNFKYLNYFIHIIILYSICDALNDFFYFLNKII